MVCNMEEKKVIKQDWVDALVRQATENLAPADEIVWLQEKFDALGVTYGMERRQDIDRLIFQKMNGRDPEKDSQLIKIRYWMRVL